MTSLNFDPLDRDLKGRKVLVALSGGIDSSISAYLLKERGAEVIGVTFDFISDNQSISDAKASAELLDIPHLVVDMRGHFEESIIRNFIEVYSHCSTPNPCIECNVKMKWGGLVKIAEDLGIKLLATGHFARASDGFVFRGLDDKKDQSYFLYRVPKKWIRRTLFPLGGFLKSDVQILARGMALPSSDRRESNDVCFFKKGKLVEFLSMSGIENYPGEFVDLTGEKLGQHNGWVGFTPGQRRGMGVASSEGRLYVVDVDSIDSRVILGPRSALMCKEIITTGTIFHDKLDIGEEKRYLIQIRHLGETIFGNVRRTGEEASIINLEKDLFAPARGQSAVFYSGDRVAGGGYIA
ncbi:tRNA 2-thiouridine(34) synthase MnmA [bacterium]|nr:tRNA 2-thiouridine(34) synthase MnmA [bacterium]